MSTSLRDELQEHLESHLHDVKEVAQDAVETAVDICKGATAGMIAGLAAAWVMNQFQAHTSERQQQRRRASGGQDERSDGGGDGRESSQQSQQEGEPATVKAAEAVSQRFFDHDLSDSEKQVAEPVVHYAMGAASGAFYGALAEVLPIASAGLGLPFGMAVWFVADEAAVPALGLSKQPTEYPLPVHADALAAHLVYGLTTDLFRRVLRTVL